MRRRFVAIVLPCWLAACTAGALPPTVPPPRSERVPAPPPSTVTLIWRPGYYDWDGKSYHWVPGDWVPREGHGPLWQDGMWHRRGAFWVWEPAHWL